MVAYVTDFGLSRFIFTASNAYKDSSTGLVRLKGSIGYIPPGEIKHICIMLFIFFINFLKYSRFSNFIVNVNAEYGMSKEISTKGDVYSFGVFMLQMMTGCSPTDEKCNDSASLHEFVDRAFPHDIYEVVDSKMLQVESNAAEVMRSCVTPLVRIGLSCSRTSPRERPDMGQVSTEILRIMHVASHMGVI
jgi:serine/threonine protein kinase